MAKIAGLLKGLIWVKTSLIAAAIGAGIALDNYQQIREFQYNIFERNQQVEESCFPDPPGLRIVWRSNDRGRIEPLVQYVDSERGIVTEYVVMNDLLPPDERLIQGLHERIQSPDHELHDDLLGVVEAGVKANALDTGELEDVAARSYQIYTAAQAKLGRSSLHEFGGFKQNHYESLDVF